MRPSIAKVALPVPLDREFEYLIPNHLFPVIARAFGYLSALKNYWE
ncbi:helicase priA [Vibrio ishigakensis]|uniref:Helicase priA n=1 Tax=Vibrio ishigakensis TaxID=1481914 RepID=A0A0B8QC48_9VIBR|nr:helicase priA [Vibrio ishigakensis]